MRRVFSVANCLWCEVEFPVATTGRPKQFCSDAHKRRAYRAVRRLATDPRCFECNRPRPARTSRYCGDVFCEQARQYRYDAAEKVGESEAFYSYLEAGGMDEADSGMHQIVVGVHGEAPPERCEVAASSLGAHDIDPFLFGEGWDVDGFVQEFSHAGYEVGQTYLYPGMTLGAASYAP
jgi:hypothetical protein